MVIHGDKIQEKSEKLLEVTARFIFEMNEEHYSNLKSAYEDLTAYIEVNELLKEEKS